MTLPCAAGAETWEGSDCRKTCHCEPVLTLVWQSLEITCHCEPARRLVWQSVLQNVSSLLKVRLKPQVLGDADCHVAAFWAAPRNDILFRYFFDTLAKNCHCEPVRRLVWQSVLQNISFLLKVRLKPQVLGDADCHVAAFGRLLAMTCCFGLHNDVLFSGFAMTCCFRASQ